MKTTRPTLLLLALLATVFAGCKGNGSVAQVAGSQTSTANVSLVVSATDAPRSGISVLSLQVTLTSAQLTPGNVNLLAAPAVLDLARLRTETSLLGTANVPIGAYTAVALTFANPSLTFENNSGASITVGGVTCANGAVCVASVPVTGLTGNLSFAGSGITLTAAQPASLALGFNLSTLLPSTLQANLFAGSTITQLTAAAQNQPFATLEDVVGTISTVNTANNTFVLHTALANYTVTAPGGTAGTGFFSFPGTACSAASFSCLAAGQIVWVNMTLQPDNSLRAAGVYFEDATSAFPEIEGVVVANTGLTPPAQFSFVPLQETPANSGPVLGSVVTVAAQSASFDVDNLGASSSTASFSFQGIQDVIVGQQVQVQMGNTSTNTQIAASRVRLRSSRITAAVSNVALPMLTLGPAGMLPTFLTASGINQILVFTVSPPNAGAFTEISGTATDITQIAIGNTVAVRGQLFKNGPSSGGIQPVALVATKIVRY